DTSLLTVSTAEGEARYRLLEPIRQYAEEKLDEAGEAPTVRRAHSVLEEALTASSASNETLLGPILGGLGDVARLRGDLGAAWALYREGVSTSQAAEVGTLVSCSWLRRFGKVLAAQGDHTRAAKLFGAAAAAGMPTVLSPVLDPLGHLDEAAV